MRATSEQQSQAIDATERRRIAERAHLGLGILGGRLLAMGVDQQEIDHPAELVLNALQILRSEGSAPRQPDAGAVAQAWADWMAPFSGDGKKLGPILTWRATTSAGGEPRAVGLSFILDSANIVRFRLDIESARALADTINEALSRDQRRTNAQAAMSREVLDARSGAYRAMLNVPLPPLTSGKRQSGKRTDRRSSSHRLHKWFSAALQGMRLWRR